MLYLAMQGQRVANSFTDGKTDAHLLADGYC
jgi:hypothetical protein